MDRYRPNYVLKLSIISMVLIIASGFVVGHKVIEAMLLGSGWILMIITIVMYVLKIKKEDDE